MSEDSRRLQDHSRRAHLSGFASAERDAVPGDHLGAFINIVAEAIRLSIREPVPNDWASQRERSAKVMEDLKWVLIGAGLRSAERNTGGYFVGRFTSTGFRPAFQEPPNPPTARIPNQVAHAVAGPYIGFWYNSAVERLILWREDTPQDQALYRATYPLGRSMIDKFLPSLPHRLRTCLA